MTEITKTKFTSHLKKNGTYACDEMIEKCDGEAHKAGCCVCLKHECKPDSEKINVPIKCKCKDEGISEEEMIDILDIIEDAIRNARKDASSICIEVDLNDRDNDDEEVEERCTCGLVWEHTGKHAPSPYGFKDNLDETKDNPNTLIRVSKWLLVGEKGLSSLSLCGVYMGGIYRFLDDIGELNHPADGADFHRCMKFLSLLPKNEQLPLIKKCATRSDGWSRIYTHWEELVHEYDRAMTEVSTRCHNIPDFYPLYALMKNIGL